MVFLSGATSNFKRAGLTTRGGGNTEELMGSNAPPTTTNQKAGWWSRAMNWVGDHSEGAGKVLSGIASLGAWGADKYIKHKGGEPWVSDTVNDFKKEVGKYADKYEQSGVGKFIKGFALKDSLIPPREERLRQEKKVESNGHVPVGYDRTKPFYINPSVGGRDPHMFSHQIANEWRKYYQQYGIHQRNRNPTESSDEEKRKLWKKGLKKKGLKKKGKQGKKGTKKGTKKNNK